MPAGPFSMIRYTLLLPLVIIIQEIIFLVILMIADDRPQIDIVTLWKMLDSITSLVDRNCFISSFISSRLDPFSPPQVAQFSVNRQAHCIK